MNQIFDWLREQINSAPIVKLLGTEYIGIRRVKQIIKKAEAKWELDCCEWKLDKEIYSYDSSCGHYLDNHGFNFCPYCGKPIKISEVE